MKAETTCWKAEKQFWFDREPSAAEKEDYKPRCPETLRHAVLLKHRDDGTMWYAGFCLWSYADGPTKDLEVVQLKIKNAEEFVLYCSETQEAKEQVSDEVFAAECERQRNQLNGKYFEMDTLESVLEGL